MRAKSLRVVISACLAVFVLAGLLGVGYIAWNPEPPRDPAAVVLRFRLVGSLREPSVLPREVPELTVYGDGRIIVVRTTWGTVAYRRILDGRLTVDAYRKLYKDGLLAGLGTSRAHRAGGRVLDAGSTHVEFLSGGRRHTTIIQQGASGPRKRLIERLVKRLTALRDDDLIRAPITYRPERTAMVAWRPDRASFGKAEREERWPLRTLPEGDPAGCTVLTPTEAQETQRVISSAGSVNWRSGGHLYNVLLRPLLPDEKDCTALNWPSGG
ncbi:hypothetical protein Acsp03_47160 [Actinomadura sp. NBRC 104412]|uniref:hypothetical protein n=1 Tax=Actinomadura sp. NBRC 104412 TaxID=3032203 RepID=UPI0024A4876E|nr:hypothetical protein [Actinomadura sp. NBRC 104412]GLZ07250.1 hypothetical protein Acsp03_47160 [Actinomadura sp. NBRC 104412]